MMGDSMRRAVRRARHQLHLERHYDAKRKAAAAQVEVEQKAAEIARENLKNAAKHAHSKEAR